MTIPFIDHEEFLVGKNHPSAADTLNRPLRDVITKSGMNPDASFPGFTSYPVVANAAARDAAYPAPANNQRVQRTDTGYIERYDQASNKWVQESLTRAAGPVVSSGAKGAKRDGITDDSQALLDMSAAIVGANGTGELDVGTHLVNPAGASISLGGHIRPLRGSLLKVAAGKNVRFTGTIERGNPFQWIDVSAAGASVTIDNADGVDPRWFGMKGDGANHDDIILNALTAALPKYGQSKLHPKGKACLFNAWIISDKDGHVYESGASPLNSGNDGLAPTLEWLGAAGGTVVSIDKSRFCKIGGLLVSPHNADVCFDIDGAAPGHISTEHTLHDLFINQDTPNRPNFVAIRVTHSGAPNNEYMKFEHVIVWGGQNGQISAGGHDMSNGMCAVTAASAIVTFDAAWLALNRWDNAVAGRKMHIKGAGVAAADLDTTVTYLNATQGTLAVAASTTAAATQFAFNANSANPNPNDGVDTGQGSASVFFGPDYIALGFWQAGIANKRIRIPRAKKTVVVADFVPSGAVAALSLTNNNIAQVVNQWAPNRGASHSFFIHTLSGTGAGQYREISSNTNDVVSWGTALSPAPDATTHFEIVRADLLDTLVSYADATHGTLSVAADLPIAGGYFVLGEALGSGLQNGANFNAKRQLSERNTFSYVANGLEIAGGSIHSKDDNFGDDEQCVVIGGAISEPCTIEGLNAEGCRTILRNNTFLPVILSGARWASDRIAPQSGAFTYGPSATLNILIGNAPDSLVIPRGCTIHNFASDGPNSNARVLSIGNVWPFTDAEMGYDTMSSAVFSAGYVCLIGEPSTTMNWAYRCFTNNRNPSQSRFGLAHMFGGWVFRGHPKVAPPDGEILPGQTVEFEDPTTGMISERTRIDDNIVGSDGRPGTLVTRTRMPNNSDSLRSVGGGWNVDGKSGRLRCDATAGDIFLNLPSNLPVGWEGDIIKIDGTNNIVELTASAGGTFNGMASVDLIGQWTHLHVRVATNVAGVNTFECELRYLGFRKIAFDWPNIANAASSFNNFAINGAKVGAAVRIAIELDTQDMELSARVSAAGTVRARMRNDTGGAIDLANANHRIWVNPLI